MKNLKPHKTRYEKSQKMERTLNVIKKLVNVIKNVKRHKEVSKELFDFYLNLFTEKLNISKDEILSFLNLISISQ